MDVGLITFWMPALFARLSGPDICRVPGVWGEALFCALTSWTLLVPPFLPNLCLFSRTPEANSRASSPCPEFEQFQIVPPVETPYLARAGKNEFLNLVPDIEEIRPG